MPRRAWILIACLAGCETSPARSLARPDPIPPSLGLSEGLPEDRAAGALEVVATFSESMPTGVTVASGGRIFVNYPRWGDPVPFTVGEVKNGIASAYPDPETDRRTFVSVQSVVVDPRNRLWALDTGSVKFGPVAPGGAKLVAFDLSTNQVVKAIVFPEEVALPTTYLNDIRFDLRRGREGVAYITDSSVNGPNGLIVVDLASGASWRRLHDHPSTKAEPGFLPFVEGRALTRRPPGQPASPLSIGSDGLAIAHDGKRIYYCPLASRRLFSVDADVLRDESATEEQVAATVRDEGMKPASDGLESDAEGRIYATAYETNSIVRRNREGAWETIAHDPRALWPDTLSLADDGHLYFTANQLHRQPDYHNGKDERERPYVLFRVKTDGTPVRLR